MLENWTVIMLTIPIEQECWRLYSSWNSVYFYPDGAEIGFYFFQEHVQLSIPCNVDVVRQCVCNLTIQDGICGTGRPQQNMGIIALRITSHSTRRDHRQHRDCGQSAEFAQRAHVPHLLGYAEEDDDHQGVPPPFLFRLYYHGFTER